MKIRAVKAFKVFDSNANPTIAVAIKHKRGIDYASAPAGTSVGKNEADSYRKDVDTDISYFNLKIAPKLIGFKFKEFEDLKLLEPKLTNVFASSRIALEFALLKARASNKGKEIYEVVNPGIKIQKFPTPLGKVIGGGMHSGIGDIQEFLFAPKRKSFSEAALINSQLYQWVGKTLAVKDNHFLRGRDFEGGWISSLPAAKLLEVGFSAKKYAAEKLNCDVEFGIDLAANSLYHQKRYVWKNYEGKQVSLQREKQISLICDLVRKYGLNYVEDPLEETDVKGFAELCEKLPFKLICTDDATCTNSTLLRDVIASKAARAVIVKPNQVGSLTKTKEFIDLAKGFGMKIVLSHRSGESTDLILPHLALAWGADYIKCGIAGGERVSKINELIRLEHIVFS